jgi:FkbM family methyltransferase
MKKFNLIDIGSAGLISDPWHDHPEAVGQVLKFEPRDAEANTPGVRFSPHALWSAETEKPFYIYRGLNGTGSSLLRQNFHYVAANYPELKFRGNRRLAETWFERCGEVSRTTLRCRTLDSVLQEERANGIQTAYDFLKVDAQGADMEILKGAGRYLRTECMGVQCELFTIPLYEDVMLLDEAVAWLRAQGFGLWKKHPAHGTFASQHDCVFLKADADTAELQRALSLPVRSPSRLLQVGRRLKRLLKS